MNELIKRLHRAKLVPALISIAFGVALIIARRSAMEVIIKIAAGMLFACGVGSVLMYLFSPAKESMQLTVGGMMAAAGVLGWLCSDMLVNLFPILTGIGLILNGLSNMAPLSTPGENAGTGLILIFSILMIVGGLFIVFHPAAVEDMLMVYIGIGYVVNGIFDLIILYRVKEVLAS
jgi:uncharacterized membrane protein HdeD (DUF308 family)